MLGSPIKFRIFLTMAALAFGSWAMIELKSDQARAEDPSFKPITDLLEQKNEDDAFNGIKLEEFENFYRDWHLVTARFRIDRDQQRVTFANPIAWKALSEGSKNFPEGAMFAKAGFQSSEDPLFPSSKVPGSQLRLMIMKRDFAKYPNTDGWGYALLNRFGTRLANGEIKYKVEKYKSIQEFETACHACHKIAAAQDYVFSRPMFDAVLSYKQHDFLSETFESKFSLAATPEQNDMIASIFSDVKLAIADAGEIQSYEMMLFEGSLPELKAPLSNLAAKRKSSFVVYDPKSKLFAMSIPLSPTSDCSRRESFVSGCLDKKIPVRNLREVTKSTILCDGISTQ
jgi:hypothetical protein